jgi:chemotaxis protein methyltransferase CheR
VLTESLCRKGFLGLGLKETLRFTTLAPRFKECDAEARIYQLL